jgi:hypothetical protein
LGNGGYLVVTGILGILGKKAFLVYVNLKRQKKGTFWGGYKVQEPKPADHFSRLDDRQQGYTVLFNMPDFVFNKCRYEYFVQLTIRHYLHFLPILSFHIPHFSLPSIQSTDGFHFHQSA